jgi:hypothetical protein
MTGNRLNTVGEASHVRLCDLELDPDNPRLVSSRDGDTQADLAVNLEMAHEAIVVAESIARHGFFTNEPLIVLPKDAHGKFRVVEGNRRFVALSGLANPALRAQFYESSRWNALAAVAAISLDDQVPVSIVETREEASAIMGFRHISGILDWTPYAQASFVANLVEDQGYTFEEIAPMIGRKRQDVAEMYRNFSISRQASEFGIDSTGLEGAFSLLTVAMGSPDIREFIGAPSGAKTVSGVRPIPDEKQKELAETITWIFGDGTPGSRKVEESRKISSLGKVIGNPVGLKSLRDGATLEVAQAAISDKGMDPIDRITTRLRTAVNALKAAFGDMDTCADEPEVQRLLVEVAEALNGLSAMIDLED